MTGTGGSVVLHVLEAVEGGTARHVVDLVRHTGGVSHHVVLPPERTGGVTDTDAFGAIESAGGTVHLVPMRRSPAHASNVRALRALRRLGGRLEPAVVHGHSAIGGALARVALGGGPAAVVYTPNGLRGDRASVAVERALGRRTDALVAVSESEGELVRRLGLVPAERVVVIPNGIDAASPPPGADLHALAGVPLGAPVVAVAGRLVPQKRPLDAVAMAARLVAAHPEAHVVLVGSGRLAGEVDRAIAAIAPPGRVHRVAVVPRLAAALAGCDVVVQPSAFEGGPYVPLEAMRAGVAVVLSDAVGNRDVVEHGTSGLVVPVGDVDALADAVVGLLRDPDRRAALAAAGRARVRARFDVDAMGAGHEVLYRSLVSARR